MTVRLTTSVGRYRGTTDCKGVMMRKWLLATALVTLFALFVGFGVAEARSDALMATFVTNTSTRGINLDGEIYWTLIRPHTADVIVTVYNVGVVKQTATILAGESWCFETTGMDSVRVARATTTVVDYALSTRRDQKPSLAPFGRTELTTIDTALDSAVTLLSAPGVREVSATFTAAQNVTLTGHLVRCTYPQAITPSLDGCVAAYWIVDFSSWDGNVMFKTIIGATGTADPDTAFYTPPVDTLYVLDTDFGGTREGLLIPITNFEGGYLAGYPYLQMQTRKDVTNIDSLYVYLVRVF